MWWQAGQQEPRRSLFQRLFRPEAAAAAPLRITPSVSMPNPAAVVSPVSGTPAAAAWLAPPAVRVPEPARVVALSAVREQSSWTGASEAERPSSGALSRPGKRSRRDGEDSRSSLVERLRRVLVLPLEFWLPSPDTALTWPGDLMPFQKEGVRALVNSERLLLADDMGLGKTLQAIAAVRILCAQRVIDAILVVAPASLLDQWRRELEKWAPELRAIIVRGPIADRAWQWEAKVHVTLVSYETLRSDFGGNKRAPVRRKVWDVVIADEAQRIKNRNATSGAPKGLQRRRSWALTGTPLENDEEELASILEFVDHVGLTSSRHYRPGVELLQRHRQLQLRRKKDDVLDDLPPKQVTKVFIPLHTRQKESYDRAEREGIVYLKSLGAQVRVQHVLELITRLKQICNADPATGHSSKLKDIRDRLGQLVAQGHRALVFSQYTSANFGVAAAASYLEAFNPLTLTGDLDQSQRARIIDRFKTADTHKALVLSLRAGGVGLNLQEASYVFHLDRWWNPAVEHQAEDRSHRFGQTAKVNVIKYACAGTIEERIDAILKRKQDLFDQLVDDVSLNLSARLSSEDIFGLFGLEAPPRS
jgi:SNF2 family DNA or RNA helicase